MGLGVWLQVDDGLWGLLKMACAGALCVALPTLLLSALSRLKHKEHQTMSHLSGYRFIIIVVLNNNWKHVWLTFPPESVLCHGCACVWLDTQLGFERVRLWCACICPHSWGGADLQKQNQSAGLEQKASQSSYNWFGFAHLLQRKIRKDNNHLLALMILLCWR